MNEAIFLESELLYLTKDILSNSLFSNEIERYSALSAYKDNPNLYIRIPEAGTRFSNIDISKGMIAISEYSQFLSEHVNNLGGFYKTCYNKFEYDKEIIQSMFKNIKYKINALKLYNDVLARTVVYLPDLNHWLIQSDDVNVPRLNLSDKSNGITLPIVGASNVVIQSIEIGRESNGTYGDPLNIDKTIQQDSPMALVDSNLETYFEYTREGTDKLVLELILKFPSSIVNTIYVDPIQYPFNSSIILERADYLNTEGNWIPWISDVDVTLNNIIYCNPVQCQQVRLKLSSGGSDIINGQYGPIQRVILGLREINLIKTSFSSQGEIISVEKIIKDGEVTLSSVDKLSTINRFSTINVFVNDKEGNWKSIETLDTNVDDIVSVNKLQAKVVVNRNSDELANGNYLYENNNSSQFYEKVALSNSGITFFSLESGFDKGSIKVYRSNGIKVGDYNTASSMQTESASEVVVKLKVKLDYNDANNIEVKVNGVLFKKVDTAPEAKEFNVILSNDTFIKFSNINPNSNIEVFIPSVSITPIKTGLDITSQELSCHPDKNLINISKFFKPIDDIIIKYPDSRIVETGYKNISNVTINYNVDGNLISSPYEEVIINSTDIFTELSGPHKFYVDSNSGIIYLSEFPSETLYISYRHQDSIALDKSEFNLNVMDNGKVRLIFPRAINDVITIKEDIGTTYLRNKKAISNKGLKFKDKEYTLDAVNKVIYLSNDSISSLNIKAADDSSFIEVPFIDGRKELNQGNGIYNIVEAAFDSYDGSVIYNWNISSYGIENINLTMGVYPTDQSLFLNQKPSLGSLESQGDWYISNSGIISLYSINTVFEEPIKIGLFLLQANTSYSQYQYSVDRKQGLVYLSGLPATALSTEYTMLPYVATYEIVEKINNWGLNQNDSLLELRQQYVDSDFAYVYYESEVSPVNMSLLKDYYSPVITGLYFKVI